MGAISITAKDWKIHGQPPSHYLIGHGIEDAPDRIPLKKGNFNHDFNVVENLLSATLVDRLRDNQLRIAKAKGLRVTEKTHHMPMGVNRKDLPAGASIQEINNES